MIKLNACLYDNVGDDLMTEVLLTRYPNYRFYYSGEYFSGSNKFLKHPNFINFQSIYNRWGKINRLVYLLTFHKSNDCVFDWAKRRAEKRCVAGVYIGGSIYIEKRTESVDQRLARESKKLKNGPLFVIGANFGPYQSPEFPDRFRSYFTKCAGVCFRETESFSLFSDIPQVRYAPDVVLNYPLVPAENTTDSVVISVIDFHSRAELAQYAGSYDRFVSAMCRQCVEEGKTPVLVAFCEYEGDNSAVDNIYQLLAPEIREQTKRVYYRDLDEMVRLFREASFVLATRFHAMILALKLKKPFFCVSYNQKNKNVLDDLQSTGYCLPEQLDEMDCHEILQNAEEIQGLDEYIQKANQQFEQLDRFLEDLRGK